MKDNIHKLIKGLYMLLDQHREGLEEEAAMISGEEDAKAEVYPGHTYEEVLGLQLLSDIALQDALLKWINCNNLDVLSVQQRQDLFGLMAEVKLNNTVVH